MVKSTVENAHTVESLIESHQRLVTHLAWKIKRRLCIHADIDDLVGFGNMGLIEAARRFESHRKICFGTFAHYRIRGAIFDGIRKMTWLPPAARVRLAAEEALDDVALALQQEKFPNLSAMERRAEESLKCLGAIYTFAHLGIEDNVAEPQSDDCPPERCERTEIMARVRELIETLDTMEAAVIKMHYFEELSLTQCASRLGCGKPWVSRLHQRALKKLWTGLSEKD